MTDMDDYRAAFDIHGDEVECSQCGATLDALTVEHWLDTINGERVPVCDRCHWDDFYSSTDPDD